MPVVFNACGPDLPARGAAPSHADGRGDNLEKQRAAACCGRAGISPVRGGIGTRFKVSTDGQSFSSFRQPSLQNVDAAPGPHPGPESVRPCAFDIAGLKCPFHGVM